MERVACILEVPAVWAARAAMVLIFLLIGAMLYEVVARYVFARPTVWAFDISYMLNGALFVLAIGYTQKCRAHVRIDFLAVRLPPRLVAIVDLAGHVVLAVGLGWVTYAAGFTALRAWRSGEVEAVSSWAPQMWPFYLSLFVGLLVFVLQLCADVLRDVDGLVKGPAAGGEA